MDEVSLGPGLIADKAAFAEMCFALVTSGQGDKAAALLGAAVKAAPGDAELTYLRRVVLAYEVPNWHLGMLQDQRRNDAYQAAIERAVGPGDHVLEIGSGFGLLAMMAARAGAEHVVTCEMNKTIAYTAREIVAGNGYSDRVKVVAKHSAAVGVDELPRPADVFVSELLDDTLLADAVLEVVEDIGSRLLRPGARIIPQAIEARVALAYSSAIPSHLETVNGFDLALLNRHRQAPRPISRSEKGFELRSAAGILFAFDLHGRGPFAPGQSEVALRSTGGGINGVLFWFKLLLDAEASYENGPHDGPSHWAMIFHPLVATIMTESGEEVIVSGSHNRRRIRIWVDVASARDEIEGASAGRLPSRRPTLQAPESGSSDSPS